MDQAKVDQRSGTTIAVSFKDVLINTYEVGSIFIKVR